MEPKVEKCRVMNIVGNRDVCSQRIYSLLSKDHKPLVLTCITEERDLGIILTLDFKFSAQTAHTTSKANNKMLGMLKNTFLSRDVEIICSFSLESIPKVWHYRSWEVLTNSHKTTKVDEKDCLWREAITDETDYSRNRKITWRFDIDVQNGGRGWWYQHSQPMLSEPRNPREEAS